jgi:hypothetical protein
MSPIPSYEEQNEYYREKVRAETAIHEAVQKRIADLEAALTAERAKAARLREVLQKCRTNVLSARCGDSHRGPWPFLDLIHEIASKALEEYDHHE